jgi:hypothetical protein
VKVYRSQTTDFMRLNSAHDSDLPLLAQTVEVRWESEKEVEKQINMDNISHQIGLSLRSTPTNGLGFTVSHAFLGGPPIQVLTEVDVA